MGLLGLQKRFHSTERLLILSKVFINCNVFKFVILTLRVGFTVLYHFIVIISASLAIRIAEQSANVTEMSTSVCLHIGIEAKRLIGSRCRLGRARYGCIGFWW